MGGVLTPSVEEFTGSAAEWDGFVRAQPRWTHFHLLGWKTVMTQALGHQCLFLAARDAEGRLAGVLPLVRVNSLLFGHYLVSMPFLNYGGPLGNAAAVQALVTHAAGLARRGRVKLLELRSRGPLPIELPVSHRKVTVLLDLVPGSPVEAWQALNPRLKNYVRRTQKAGVTVRFGLDQVGSFYEVFSRHMHELGTPTHGRRLFETIAAVFPDDAWFGCAYYGGRPVAAGCGLRWADEVEVTWASAVASAPELRPNALLYWAFIERAAQENLRTFNFGRSTPDSGPHEFKRRWGSRDEPLWWYDLAARDGTTTPSPQDPALAWGPRLWKRMPAGLARALGPSIVRCLP
ncbi:MAG TPA: FemAB family XrtA/PEP-CTERM system-associated protein [Gemmatimonadales bacterium]|nr:FemAB family XrtA/PEP-CTERM system-associated protein [Gemmatimonadales bacterium]